MTIQRGGGTSWTTVATGSGGAAHKCAGTATRTYRLKEAPALKITVPCS